MSSQHMQIQLVIKGQCQEIFDYADTVPAYSKMISCFLGKRGNRRKEMDKEEKMEKRERDGREGT